MLSITVISLFLIREVNVNDDMTEYLPEDSEETREFLDRLKVNAAENWTGNFIALTFRSLVIPLLLVAIVQCGVCTNMSFIGFSGDVLSCAGDCPVYSHGRGHRLQNFIYRL
ncbi:MAG: hypothetical protein ACI4AA_04075 [Lachnospiraceae bacterium]